MNFIATPLVPKHENRMIVLNASNNKINVNNEGIKYGGYHRVLARRKADNLFSQQCKSSIYKCSVPRKILDIQNPLAICAYDNYLYVASIYLNITISRFNLITNQFDAQWVQISDSYLLFDLVANGNYLYAGLNNKIIRINITTGVVSDFIPATEGLYIVFGLTIYNNELYIINNDVPGGIYRISKINLTTGISSLVLDWYVSIINIISMRENNNLLYILNYDINSPTSIITRYNLITNEVIENWISIDVPGAMSLTFYNNIMYVSNFLTISKINVLSNQVHSNWIQVAKTYNTLAPFLFLTNYTIKGTTKLYVSAFNSNSVFSILIDSV